MRTTIVLALVLVFGSSGIGAQSSADRMAGQWTGTWDGAGSGNFDLNLEKKNESVAGKVAVTTDGGNYESELKGIALNGPELKATYDFPLDPSSEVAIVSKFDGDKASGTWSLRPKGGGAEIASGTFAVKKK